MEIGLENAEQEIELEQLELVEAPDEDAVNETDQDAETLDESAQDEEEQEQAADEKQPTIFISYNHNPNDSRVATRIYEELSQQYEVFLDYETIKPGEDYDVVTQAWLNRADFIIALISAESIKTFFIKAELEDAYEQYRTKGRPNVIPVRINYNGPYGFRLSGYIGHFQALTWDNENYALLFEKLRAALSNIPIAVTKSLIVGTDILPISDALRTRWAKTFVEPPELKKEDVLFEDKRLLWVTGDAGVRNYVARSLAARTKHDALYEVTKSRKWSEINNTNVSDSTIILRDALPAAYLDNEATAIGEWHSLRAIIERNNIIIATSPDDEFERLEQELRRYEFTDYVPLRIGRNSYAEEAKLQIYTRILDHEFEVGEIDESRYAWASALLKESEDIPPASTHVPGRGRTRAHERLQRESRGKFRENIQRWSPSDIERFALSLPQVEKFSDIVKLLQRNADIEDEIRSWFLALDDATRCFILVLAIFPELNNNQLWEKYKIVADYLRRFDPSLRLLPLGICRRRAHPHVSVEGPIYLADERVSEAIRQEVARSYREYFIELTPVLKEWSVPPDRNPTTVEQKNQRKEKIEEDNEVRIAIARIVGIVGRLGLDDLLEILDYWATDSNFKVRQSVAVALEQTAKSQTGVNHALNLLEKWCLNITSPSPLRWRAMSAAIALGNITSAAPDPYVTLRALHCLERFSKSKREDARFYASIAIKRVARHAPLSATEEVLSRLAADKKPEVRINVAAALNEARSYNEDAAAALSERWALSEDVNHRWVALCAIVTARRGQNGAGLDKYQRLLELLEHKEIAISLASVLGETVKDDHYGQAAEKTFMHLAQKAEGRAWENLASGLADVPLGKLENKLLPLLRYEATPLLEERVIDIRRAVLQKLLTEPERFLNTLKAWLNQERARLEVFRALMLLLGEGPGGCRSQLISALAEHYSQESVGVNGMLARLEDLAPAHFASLAPTVRHEAFSRLLENPLNFIELAEQDLANDEWSGDAQDALEALALDKPQGSREAMFQALEWGYAHAPELTKSLLLSLKSSGSPELTRAVYEFNYRLLENGIVAPATFPALVLELFNQEDKNAEALSLLNYLAGPEPNGRRSALVRSLVESKILQVTAVDELLARPELKQWANLANLQAEITRAFYVRKIFSRKFVTTGKFVKRLFTRR